MSPAEARRWKVLAMLIPRDRYDPFEVLAKVGRWDTGGAAGHADTARGA